MWKAMILILSFYLIPGSAFSNGTHDSESDTNKSNPDPKKKKLNKKPSQKNQKKSEEHTHESSDGHSNEENSLQIEEPNHSHEEEIHAHSSSKLALDLSLSATKNLSDNSSGSSSSGSTSGESDGGGHAHLLSGDHAGGDAPSTDNNEGGGTASQSIDPMLTTRLNYAFLPRLGFMFLGAYGMESGLQDVEGGLTGNYTFENKSQTVASLTATYPLSKASKDNFKITTVKSSFGLNYLNKKISYGIQMQAAYAWYSKTIIYYTDESDETTATNLNLSTGSQPQGPYGQPIGPSDNNLTANDREFSRWGTRLNFGYQFTSGWRYDSSLEAFYVQNQFGTPNWFTSVTLAQINYTKSSFSAYSGLLLAIKDVSFLLPTQPSINIGISYKVF